MEAKAAAKTGIPQDSQQILEVMRRRHSVRSYTDRPIPDDIRAQLGDEVERLNKESGLHMQLLFDEPECFSKGKAHYGKFSGVRNYLSIVGAKAPDLDVRAGHFGEMVVILAQSLGLSSCWVGLTHGRSHATVGKGEKEAIVIALGYGANDGVAHRSKPAAKLCQVDGPTPKWFSRGMEAAMLSPTAMNQQKFLISYDGSKLTARVNGRGFFAKVDLGIVMCDFELASGHAFDR